MNNRTKSGFSIHSLFKVKIIFKSSYYNWCMIKQDDIKEETRWLRTINLESSNNAFEKSGGNIYAHNYKRS